jgi:FkbM family methyltransferase
MNQATQAVPDLIFDVGSNNGDDLPYYLLKAQRVVAIEANPDLCSYITARFAGPIREGRLFVENVALVMSDEEEVDFYLHNRYHVLSTVAPSADSDLKQFIKTRVSATNIASLVCKYGTPYYVKIDVEGYDEQVLSSLIASGIKPSYISAESHKIGVFALLSEGLSYRSFKLVDGRSVSSVYRRAIVSSPTLEKAVVYSFPHHSAGPFGNDIFGEWMDKSTLLRQLALNGLGWRDIHASLLDEPTLCL